MAFLDTQAVIESLVGLDIIGFLGVLKHVLGQRGDFVQPLTTLLVPNIIYPPAAILEDRRCVGVVKSFSPEKKFGFISCPTILEEFQKDCIVLTSQLRGLCVGSRVNFAVCLEKDGKPKAYDLHEVVSVCKFFAHGACKDGTGCRFLHDYPQDRGGPSVGGPCPFFAQGFCNAGSMCPYVHAGSPGEALALPQPNSQKRSFAQGPGGMQSLADVREQLGVFVGIVKRIVPDKGFGFITCPALVESGYQDDVFMTPNTAVGRQAGETVQFSAVITNANKLQATEVELVGAPGF